MFNFLIFSSGHEESSLPFLGFSMSSLYFAETKIQVPIMGNFFSIILELLWFFMISFPLIVLVSLSCMTFGI